MTAITDHRDFEAPRARPAAMQATGPRPAETTDLRARAAQAAGQGHAVDQTYWGYILRSTEPVPVLMVLLQALSWAAAVGFLLASFGLWVVPGSLAGDGVLGLKMGASAILGGMSALLFLFAGRGLRSEVQIDTSLGEVREVARSQSGRSSLIARHGFDSIGGVFLDRSAAHGALPDGHAWLVLRLGNSGQTLPIIAGPEASLARLRDRIGRDLLSGATRAARVVHDMPSPIRRCAAA